MKWFCFLFFISIHKQSVVAHQSLIVSLILTNSVVSIKFILLFGQHILPLEVKMNMKRNYFLSGIKSANEICTYCFSFINTALINILLKISIMIRSRVFRSFDEYEYNWDLYFNNNLQYFILTTPTMHTISLFS